MMERRVLHGAVGAFRCGVHVIGDEPIIGCFLLVFCSGFQPSGNTLDYFSV
jgi:hypothetical protein